MAELDIQIIEILKEADGLDEGPGQIALVEEAARLADILNDDEWCYDVQMRLTKAATFGGRPDIAIVSFTRSLAQYDREPQRYNTHELFWHYKWVVRHLDNFPAIPRAQIESLIDDMAERFKAHGSTLHCVHMVRRDVAVEMYDRERAEAAHKRFVRVERDDLSDCAACVNDGTVGYHLLLDDDEAAVEAARPALEGRRGMTCAEVPHRTHAYVLLPFLRLGKLKTAERSYRAGYKMIRENPKFIYHKAHHLAYLALTGNLARATRLFERHLPEAVETPGLTWRFEFYAAARLYLDLLCRRKVIPLVKVPEPLRAGDDAHCPATAVAAWLDRQIAELAMAFDARNGNDGFAQKAKWFRAQAEYETDYPLD